MGLVARGQRQTASEKGGAAAALMKNSPRSARWVRLVDDSLGIRTAPGNSDRTKLFFHIFCCFACSVWWRGRVAQFFSGRFDYRLAKIEAIGSQILASTLCGREQVFRRSRCEVGFMNLPLTTAGKADMLTAQLESGVDMFVWHNDEVRAAHPDMTILAHSTDCPNQIWRFRDQPIWGIQGHPELTRETAVSLFDNEQAIFERDGANIAQLKADAHDAPEAKTLLTRFAEIIQS